VIRLTTAVGSYPPTEALLNGEARSSQVELDFSRNEQNIVSAFRKMIRELAYDVCELGTTTYLSGLDYDVPLVALPVFPLRSFPAGAIMVNREQGISEPGQLEGKRVGARTHTVTAVVWARALLQELYGVDPSSITWVINDKEHVEPFKWPANVEYDEGADLSGMLERGELAAGIGIYRGHADHVVPLFPDTAPVERAWYDKTGVYPIQHLVVLRRELAQRDPTLAPAVVGLFEEAKDRFLARLAAGERLEGPAQALADRRQLVGPDPVPYGIEANRRDLEAMLRYSKEQGILHGDWSIEDIFTG
jgi:4,5-dihydroxyphthalate decarboxylase